MTRGLSQKQLAEILGTTNSSVCDWEKGRSEPDGIALMKLAGCLNVSTDYLLGRTDELGAVVMPGAMQLSDPERELVACFRKMPAGSRENVLSIARTLAAHV